MSETSIKPISGVRPTESGAPSKDLLMDHEQKATNHKPTAAELQELTQRIKKEQAGGLSNVSIHFRLDNKTNDLTVFVVDRKTKRVLRSIPASELHKLQAGDLLKLTA